MNARLWRLATAQNINSTDTRAAIDTVSVIPTFAPRTPRRK